MTSYSLLRQTCIEAILFAVCVASLASLTGCYQKIKYSDFRSSVETISKEIVDLIDRSVLARNERFRHIARHSKEYKDYSLTLLQENVPLQEKEIVVYAMQSLSLEDYLNFISQLMDAVRAKKINPDLLERTLTPDSSGTLNCKTTGSLQKSET